MERVLIYFRTKKKSLCSSYSHAAQPRINDDIQIALRWQYALKKGKEQYQHLHKAENGFRSEVPQLGAE